ncbi:cadmium resistance transporter (plasmid) [Kovacikia minuta CCNUW1]|uniref:cadmium resistance transporter n=1 Tax=Kovacikia minuta TaxID=2931930 RepID=UPI001CCB7FDE|nr:cadmium resistance transporter [Kovacikia minuta]UBF30418.1 cadmium resistance transporter [Kovacikia minuta CCNUW1]
MSNLITAFSAGITAFVATNLDDILILLLFFSQINTLFRRRHIIAGQYLGFAGLVVACLPGFFGSALFPRPWIGLLGLVPIAIGLNRFLNQEEDTPVELQEINWAERPWYANFLSPQAYGVAAVTFANGGDNIGIYIPLFANSAWEELLVILGVFFSLVGIWCYTAFQLTRLPVIADVLTRYGNQLVPFVLIGLGMLILIDSRTLENRGLATLALVIGGLVLLMLFRNAERTAIMKSELDRQIADR